MPTLPAAALAGKPKINAPTIVLDGEMDTVSPSTSEGQEFPRYQ
jgi:hypothetical protein